MFRDYDFADNSLDKNRESIGDSILSTSKINSFDGALSTRPNLVSDHAIPSFFKGLDCLKMPFTPEQDAFILMAHFRSGTRNPNGSWSYSIQSCIEQYFEAFPEDNIPYPVFKNHRLVLIKRYEEKHCICKGKSTGRPTILTENVVDDIRHRMERSPTKSVSQLSAQTASGLNYVSLKYSINYELVPLQALNPVKHIFDIL
ncbi:hypothetical protein NQ317_019300 [Molorchus minor]|uniref:Uncharacterized protein n=1 Tax=Molorchus minor TaxID=1323400 RepID=A0ABQ9J7I5_9CUCU|nr:hypothetical protein NQ317_019300 [Molorchus minor]